MTRVRILAALAALGLAGSLASCGGGGDVNLPDACLDFGICDDDEEMRITPSGGSWYLCTDPRRSNLYFETQNSGFADVSDYRCQPGRFPHRSEASCTTSNGTWYNRAPGATPLPLEEFRQNCLSRGGRLGGAGAGTGTGGGGTGTGTGTDGGGASCSSVESALRGWRGHPNDHARFHCAQACIPGQNRTAACQILRQWPPAPGHSPGTAARQCSYCGG